MIYKVIICETDRLGDQFDIATTSTLANKFDLVASLKCIGYFGLVEFMCFFFA